MNQLTKQQQSVYDYIRQCIVDRGYGPTVREIGEHMGISSPNGVMCHLRALEKKRMIVRSANKSRAIELSEPLLRGDRALDISGAIQAGIVQLSTASLGQLKLGECFKSAEQYLLNVRDDSLLSLNIKVGDQLLVSKQGSPTDGQLVVAQNLESGSIFVGQVQSELGLLRVCPLAAIPMPTPAETPMNLLGVVVGVLRFF